MNIEELLRALPSREEIANVVGRQIRGTPPPAATDLVPALGIFSTGMLLGAGLALLFAPRTGSEVRHDIADKAGKLGHQARDLAMQAGRAGPADGRRRRRSWTRSRRTGHPGDARGDGFAGEPERRQRRLAGCGKGPICVVGGEGRELHVQEVRLRSRPSPPPSI